MVLDLCWTGVLSDTDTGIFSGIRGIFHWYWYHNNSTSVLVLLAKVSDFCEQCENEGKAVMEE